MSTRNLDIAEQLVAGENAELVVFVFLDFLGEPLFVGSHVGIVEFAGEDWLGIGTVGSIEPISESIELDAAKFRLVLPSPSQELLAEVLYENTAGRRVEVYLGSLDENGQLVADPALIIVGSMGPPEVVLGKQSGVSIAVEDVRAGLDSYNGRRSSLVDHQRDWPGDKFFEFLPKMMDHKYVFNGQEFGVNGTPRGGVGPRPDPNEDRSRQRR